MGDRLLRGLVRPLLRVFYRRIEVVGLDRVPATGPVIVAANHQNALVDPMLLLATIPRRLRRLAKAPLFRHPVIGPFLCLAGAIPVHRRQDPGSDPAQNVAMFRAAAATLGAGGAILIFPEGVSQAEPVLMPLRTGAARILLGAAERVTLLPVGLTFHEPGSFRAGWALVLVGTPVPVDDCVARARMEPEAAVRETTDRLAEALRRLIVEARDRQILRLLGIAEAIWRAEAGEPAADPTARTAWMQQALRGYRYLSARDSARVDALMREVERYAKDLELAGLAGDELPPAYPGAAVARYALREGLSLFGGLPLALWGLANHGIPYQATAAAVRLLRPSPDTEATYKLAVAVLLYPLAWLGEAWVAWWLGGGWLLAVFLASLVPTGFFALTWWERLARVRRDARAFFRFLLDRDLYRRLLARRRGLGAELVALAALVPESVRSGTAGAAGR